MLGNDIGEISNETSQTSDKGEYSSFLNSKGDNKTIEPSETDSLNEAVEAHNSDTSACSVQALSDMYNDIVGTKCRAPYTHDWGAKIFGNALIESVVTDTELEIPRVR